MYRFEPLLHIDTIRLTRRAGLSWALGAGLASICQASAAQVRPWVQIADDVYVFPGANDEVSEANLGVVCNTAVLRSGTQALVVDPGPHWRRGRALRQWLERDLGLSVSAVVNTHPHPENVLANAAFADLPIYASARTRQLMAERCEVCRANLQHVVGAAALENTAIVVPQYSLSHDQIWQWGQRDLQVAVFDHAHSYGDLALFDVASQVLFAGGLVYRERVPEMTEASALGWLQALRQLSAWPARYVVGQGYGLPSQTITATYDYLNTLVQQVQQAIERGTPEASLELNTVMQAWRGWVRFDQRQALNQQHVWAELEAIWWQSSRP